MLFDGEATCGPEMDALWAEGGTTRVQLLRALCALLDAWVAAAGRSFDEMSALLAAQRQHAIVADLDARILQLGGAFEPSLAATVRELRRVREELAALGRR